VDAFAQAFGEVRSALAARPVSPGALWSALERTFEVDPARHAEVVVRYCVSHRAEVPAGLRRVEGLDALARHVEVAPFATFDLWVSRRFGALAEARQAWAGCVGLDRVRGLNLRHTRLDPDNVAAVCELELPALEQLDLSHNRLYGAGFEELCGAPWMAGLGSLRLHDARVDDASLEALGRGGEAFSGLEVLDVSKNGLGAPGAGHVLRAGFMGRLRSLDMSWNPIGDAPLDLLGALDAQAPLRSLAVCDARLTEGGAGSIARARGLAGLTRLDLRANAIGDAGAALFAGSAPLANLRELALSTNRIGHAGAAALARSAHLTALEELDLSWNPIGDEGVRALARSPSLSGLHTLGLFDVGMGAPGVRALARSAHLSGLRRLNLGSNRLGDEAVRELLASGVCAGLERLDLSMCGLTDEGIVAVANAPALSNLDALVVHGNQVSERGLDALERSPHLKGLAWLP
jgi:Ran GTPase-activating protein (RanGAP) involved in mRNA processing and transport